MTVARRLVQSFAASVLGPAVTVLVQLVNVPFMLRLWGPELFGEWLMLSAIPTYLLLSDRGFGNVAGSAMTMRVHAGDRAGAIGIFQSTFVLVSSTSLLLAVVSAGVIYTVPLATVFHLHALTGSEARMTLLLLSWNSLLLLQWSVLMAAYRATEHYATGMLYVNLLRILEGLGVFYVLFTHGRPPGLAAYMLIVTIAGSVLLALQQRRFAPWLPLGIRYAKLEQIRELVRPALAYMGFPACAAISTQGMTLVAGFALGPIAVAVFNPMRTLSRIPLQITDAIKNSAWPELSAAFGRGDHAFARRLHRGAVQAAIIIAAVLVLLLWPSGPLLFRLWTHGRISMDVRAFHLLLIVVFANSIWNTSASVAMSVNRHERVSLAYLAMSVVSIVVAYSLCCHFGLSGIAVGMLVADASMTAVVLRTSTRILQDPLRSFLVACVRPKEVKSLLTKLRGRLA